MNAFNRGPGRTWRAREDFLEDSTRRMRLGKGCEVHPGRVLQAEGTEEAESFMTGEGSEGERPIPVRPGLEGCAPGPQALF